MQVTNAATGAYTVTLLDNVLHALGPNGENDATAALQYSITDADGSTVNGTLTVTFDDDAPTATAEASQNVAEGATVTGTLDFAGGADGATVTHIGATALVFNPADANYSQAIDIGAGFIKVKADGSYSFTADNPGLGLASTTFTVTDADGDTAQAAVSFAVADANAPSPGAAAAAVDDDALAGGNPASTTGDLPDDNADGDNNEATFSGTLGGSVGPDGAGSNGFSFAGLNGQSGTVGQETVTYSWTAGSHADRHHRRRHTARHGAVHGAGHRCGDGRLHGDAARQRAARPGPERRERRHRGAAVLDHRRRRLHRQRHADRHLRRRCAERDGEPGRAARRRCACRRQSRDAGRWRRRSRHSQYDRDAGARLWRRRRRHDAADGGGQLCCRPASRRR